MPSWLDREKQLWLFWVILAVVTLVFCILIPEEAVGQESPVAGWIEFQENFDGVGDAKPQINIYARGPLKGMVGWTVFAEVGPGEWAEGLVGLTYTPYSWLDLSAMAGIETYDQSPFRYGGSLWIGKDRFSFVYLFDDGGTDYWQRNLGKVEVIPTFSIGVIQETFFGTGPYVEKRFGKVILWGAYDPKDKQGLLTVQFNY